MSAWGKPPAPALPAEDNIAPLDGGEPAAEIAPASLEGRYGK